MLIKNNAPRLRYIGGKPIGPNEVKNVPDNWKHALTVEFETGELTLLEGEEPTEEVAEQEEPAPKAKGKKGKGKKAEPEEPTEEVAEPTEEGESAGE